MLLFFCKVRNVPCYLKYPYLFCFIIGYSEFVGGYFQ